MNPADLAERLRALRELNGISPPVPQPAPLAAMPSAPLMRRPLATCRPPKLPPDGRPRVLIPYDPTSPEVLTVGQAAALSGCSTSTIRRMVEVHHIGRKIRPGCTRISRAALFMAVENDRPALEAYLAGERGGVVAPYFARFTSEAA